MQFNYKKKKNLYGMILGVLLAFIGAVGQINSKSSSSTISEAGLHELFSKVLYHVKNDYVEEISKQKIWFGAIRGLLKATGDPHTRFMDVDQYSQLNVSTKGEFGGLGVEIVMKNGYLTVVTPIDGTPAMRAGIKPGDQIIEINKKSAKNISISEAVKKLRGTPGTSINLTISRKGQETLVNVDIVREIVKIKVVQTAILKSKDNKSIGYLKLKQFSAPSQNEVISAVKSFNDKNIKGMILDLRWNPGGLLVVSRAIANIFIKEGVIVSTRGRHKEENKIFSAYPKENIFGNKPLVILVNEGSASASEIVTGAIKDHKRGLIIGKKTYGKGSVQSVIPLEYNTGIALTIQKYYTPSGVCIHKKGIIPDIIVSQPKFTKIDNRNYIVIREEKLMKKFLKKGMKYTQATIQKWQSLLKSKNLPLSDYASKFLLKKELVYVNHYPTYDLEFDNQLKRAIVEVAKRM